MSGDSDDENHEEAVYKTYLQPVRVPPPRVEPPPPPPEPESDPVAAASPAPPPPEAPPQAASPAPPAPQKPPPDAAARHARDDFKNFEFRTPGQTSGRRRLLRRAAVAVVAAVALALAYPLVNPFGSSSGSSLTQYLQRFQPIALRADQDRKSVQAAVNAVRRNPKTRTAAARSIGQREQRPRSADSAARRPRAGSGGRARAPGQAHAASADPGRDGTRLAALDAAPPLRLPQARRCDAPSRSGAAELAAVIQGILHAALRSTDAWGRPASGECHRHLRTDCGRGPGPHTARITTCPRRPSIPST